MGASDWAGRPLWSRDQSDSQEYKEAPMGVLDPWLEQGILANLNNLTGTQAGAAQCKTEPTV